MQSLLPLSPTQALPVIGGADQMTILTRSTAKRSDFSKDFIFGSASSAFQTEGAWNEDGKGTSNWDYFTQAYPGKFDHGDSPSVAIDGYHKFKDDMTLIQKVGLDAYRFSIAWPRILPRGKLCHGVSREGIKHYNDLIDALLEKGIVPFVTLFHWDVPQCLEQEYGGFLSSEIRNDFRDFADVCFWEFGDRVKNWITLNEPWAFCLQGYVLGNFPPGRGGTTAQHLNLDFVHHRCYRTPTICSNGNPGTEPYIVAHNLLLSHAKAVEIYREKYKAQQGGQIGITNVGVWYEPLTNSLQDRDAVPRSLDFVLGWFLEPIVNGDYPQNMRQIVQNRLPKFTTEEKKSVTRSYDFLGINYYTTNYVSYEAPKHWAPPSYITDLHAIFSTSRDGIDIGKKGGSDWLYIVPHGIYDLMSHIQDKYKNPDIYITENGVDQKDMGSLTIDEGCNDKIRIYYHNDHLIYLKKAIDKGVRVKGYFIWSMFDNFETNAGYSSRFGIFYIDYKDGLYTRYPKDSAKWWMKFLDKKALISLKRQDRENDNEGYDEGKKQKSLEGLNRKAKKP